MSNTLVYVKPDGQQREIPLKTGKLVLGRQTGVHIRIPVDSVSRQHCEIIVQEGKVAIHDLGSRNGTFVNKRRVQQSELSAGDVVVVGPAIFVMRVNGQPSDVATLAKGSEATAAAIAAHDAGTKASKSSTPGAQPAPSKSVMQGDPDDSSVVEFDFLDDDDDQPKL